MRINQVHIHNCSIDTSGILIPLNRDFSCNVIITMIHVSDIGYGNIKQKFAWSDVRHRSGFSSWSSGHILLKPTCDHDCSMNAPNPRTMHSDDGHDQTKAAIFRCFDVLPMHDSYDS